ncbi:MAG: pseudaminic acid cytidylyltransferase [Rhodobacteraceae bacterium]|nr:pseudaminic acid cytidylyltransferase [Paracoccaceae bacterium]
MRVAIIPARGGSKRIPRKNIKAFGGRPMIAWSILEAQESGCFDQILVSTDDDEIADVAKDLGADVPFRRPEALADDQTPTVPVIAHAVQWLADHGTPPEEVCCLYAAAPFVQAADLLRGLEALRNSDAAYAFPVTSFPFPIQRAVRLNSDHRVEMFYPEHSQTRSQDLPEAYHDAGQFYWGHARAWLEGLPVIGPNSTSIILPRYRVQDIDTPEDWDRAERLFQVLQAEG